MDSIDCDRALELIDALWEEIPSDDEWLLLSRHLKNCSTCAGLFNDLDEVSKLRLSNKP